MSHPLTIGFILITQTILISLFTGIYTFIFWFSYSLFLIFIGGILILFIYITSLASNEIFKLSFNPKIFIFSITFFFSFFYLLYFIDIKNFLFNNKTLNNENIAFTFWQISIEKNFYLLNKIYNFPINIITILIVNYLFLTLIATVKITNIFKGPIRSKYL